MDISTIGLEDLRTRIVSHFNSHRLLLMYITQTFINQDVSLFSGTIRSNVDPFEEHDDQECWDALRRCHLIREREASGQIKSLDTPISQTGSLSAGERQLVALARAVLRGSQVVVMDEATSAIDLRLDDMVHSPLFL
jgi:ABC-type multidrug transport system fused ATPase/permease subunit